MSAKPLVYLILGAAGSGRREVLRDLIEDGLPETAQTRTIFSAAEAAGPDEEKLAALPRVKIERWNWEGEKEGRFIRTERISEEVTHIFFVVDGRAIPVDQVEAFSNWLPQQNAELGRVITVVNCQLAEKHSPLLHWFEACIHFSDVVLFNRREGVANKWLSDFQRHFDDQYYPCLFEFVKAGRVKNPLLVLEPQARRLSQGFDEHEVVVVDDIEIGVEIEGEEPDPEEEGEDPDDGLTIPEDPYFARRNGGRRSKEIPDLAKYLDQK